MEKEQVPLHRKIKHFIVGKPRDVKDRTVFHNISLVAFFAWVGLGSDGLSSSCYGPPEAFLALGKHHYLSLIIGIMTAITIFIIAESYSQIIELFPTGGGGYLVSSKLLSPYVGMISGCALLIDYMLTITLSIASGADALFSLLPVGLIAYKLWFALGILAILIILNLRGVKESVTVLMPIFLVFVATHALAIIFAIGTHFFALPGVAQATVVDISRTTGEMGLAGMFLLIMRAYSMGAGTYTGIEAVCNGIPILREPKVETAKKTMNYMVISLATVVLGLMLAYVLYGVGMSEGKTLNAVLFAKMTAGWGTWGLAFVLITLVSEAAILFVAAQTGFLDGPRVLANMAIDRWIPKRFALLSDRLVTQNGILIMGVGSMALLIASKGNVGYLVILYSINVFIDFSLSQLGMVKHWLTTRSKQWIRKIIVNAIGLTLTTFILTSIVIIKFMDGGWITLVITGSLATFTIIIKRAYIKTDRLIKRLDMVVDDVESIHPVPEIPVLPEEHFDTLNKTAVVVVKDFTGVGLKTLFSIFRSFGRTFKNVVFVQVGLLNAGVFKSSDELHKVEKKVKDEVAKYVDLMQRHGYHSEGYCLTGIDVVEELEQIAPEILKKYPNATFFGGQVVFLKETMLSKLLHNYTLFTMQKRLYNNGIPLFVLPIDIR